MKKKIAAKSRGPISDSDARKISKYLASKFPDGELTAKEILELARPPSSYLHRFFEWDDSVAAERYRLNQARKIIQVLVVEIEGQIVREFTSPIVVSSGERKSVRVEFARRSEDLWKQVLAQAMNDANNWSLRYERLKELTLIRKAIKRVGKNIERKLK